MNDAQQLLRLGKLFRDNRLVVRRKGEKATVKTHYEVSAIGTAWAGFECVHLMHFAERPTVQQIRSTWGDVQDVSDWQTVKVTETRKGDWNRETVTTEREIVKKWDSPEHEDMFLESYAQ